MILSAIPKQFTLNDHGQVFYQSNSTNPLPGVMIGRVTKGASLLRPHVELLAEFDCGTEDRAQVAEFLSTWLKAYIYTTLQPLFNLIQFEQEPPSQPQTEAKIETEASSQTSEPESPAPESPAPETAAPETAAAEASQAATAAPESPQTAPKIPECVQSILLKVFEGMGISPRADNESAIAQLDVDMRKILRDKKLRMGPVLLFLPELNKPASIRLRGLLWSLFHDQPLPAPLPKDGAMSAVVAAAAAVVSPVADAGQPENSEGNAPPPNPEFYRAIGYPIYGPRAIRIDMLDRVINSIYDGAKDGKFQAKHTMAEWIGCPIADLYAILTALGHKRIENSAPQISPQEIPQEKQQGNHQIAANAESGNAETANAEPAAAETAPTTAPINVPQQMSLFDDPAPALSPALSPTPPHTAAPESVPQDGNGADNAAADGAKSNRANSPLDRAKKTAPAKPQLDFFILRRGKAYAPARTPGTAHRDERHQKHGGPFNGKHRHGAHSHARDKMAVDKTAPENTGGEAQSLDSRPSKKFSKPDAFPPERYPAKGQKFGQKFGQKTRDGAEGDADRQANKGEFKGKSGEKFGGKGGDRSENRAHKDRDFAGKKPERSDRKSDSFHKKSEPRIYTAEAATHDNPFAVLKGLGILSGK